MDEAPIIINQDKCKGCKKCVKGCPFGALEMVEKKATLVGDCRACMSCVEACPFGAITARKNENANAADLTQYKNVWVFAEQRGGKIHKVVFELLATGRRLADDRGCELCAVLLGDKIADQAQNLIQHGADKVYVVDQPSLGEYEADTYTDALYKLIDKYKPEVILAGATAIGRSFVARAAVRARTGLTADCTNLSIDKETFLLHQTRPAFGGNIMATIMTPNHRPQMSTVRPGVFRANEPDPSRNGEVLMEQLELVARKLKLVKSIRKEGDSIDIAEAEILISGGRGMGKAENFGMLEELAHLLGGTVSASRPCVDAGWISSARQVGQTGKTVAPKIYMAFGISGAIQHLAGISGADYVIAVNRDENAPIFGVANLGIVGDVMEIIPALIEALKKVKAGN